MSAFIHYFRLHPWQRRVLTALATLVIALIAAIALAVPIRDWMLMRRLCSDDIDQRDQGLAAMRGMMQRVEPPQSIIDRLEEGLDTDDDTRFDRIAQALSAAHRFSLLSGDLARRDRLWSIRLQTTTDPQLRMEMIETTLVGGRQNQYVRRMMRLAAADADANVRIRAALLAAMLHEDAALEALLGDKEPAVRAAAALDAGLAGRSALAEKIRPLLEDKDDLAAASAAYALATMGDRRMFEALPGMIATSQPGPRQEGLLHALRLAPPQTQAKALHLIFDRASDKNPSPLAIVLAGAARYAPAGKAIRKILDQATGREDPALTEAHVLAALLAARQLAVPVEEDVYALMLHYWSPPLELTMIAAAEVLGDQLGPSLPMEIGGASPHKMLLALRAAAEYSPPLLTGQTQPAQTLAAQSAAGTMPEDRPADENLTMPLARAAAAAALWRIRPSSSYIVNEAPADEAAAGLAVLKYNRQSSAFYVHLVAGSDSTLSGDYIAWHLARIGSRKPANVDSPHAGPIPGGIELPQAFETGLGMLPLPGAPPEQRVYNENVRAAGAMLLAMAAANDDQKAAALARIVPRVQGSSRETDPYTAGAYQCALLMLGDGNFDAVRRLASNREFPQRRVLTALLWAGDVRCLDEILWTPSLTNQEVAYLLINKGIAEVVAALVKDLPPVDAVASPAVMHWQTQILRDAYLLRRGQLKSGAPR
ncbi:MAG: HEAT repeat domain-containing protein [Planctomycetaceae bacterium]|nr:hypothetical protein [Planctomycetaceae bacterium]